MREKKIKYSEIFNSIQGEGHYTGKPTVWLRYFMCNLQCNGFGQDDPTDPSTYDLPYERIDVTNISTVEELPVFNKGCDSSYTWAKNFCHLMKEGTSQEIKDRLQDSLKTESNPEGLFKHPVSKQTSHLCFTGGEPLMKQAQLSTIEIIDLFVKDGNIPESVTYETNGTQKLTDQFKEKWVEFQELGIELFFSVSPKLFTVSGEQSKRAIKPLMVKDYYSLSKQGQLKFVLGKDEKMWENMEEELAKFREAGVHFPVWIMPVSATMEDQQIVAGDISKKAFENGYNVAARVHTYLFGNQIGT